MQSGRPNGLKALDARTRIIAAFIVSALSAGFLPSWLHLSARILCLWNAGMICFLGLTWLVMLKATPKAMRHNAQQQDESRLIILSLITAAACISILAIGFMLSHGKGASAAVLTFYVALAALTIVGSWLLVHTIFALHYAHGYYQTKKHPHAGGDHSQIAAGLDFPSDHQPDYWDFLYFSFVIGMTSQVSDISISSRSLRRLALLHGVLSFFFNTTILAMSINIVAGLI